MSRTIGTARLHASRVANGMKREMVLEVDIAPVLLLGIGNVLLSDDGAGIHVVRAIEKMQRNGDIPGTLVARDGGTIGLGLLADLQDHAAFIAVDAMEMAAAPGTVNTFRGTDMDRQLGGTRKSAHEVALADLVGAALLSGCMPAKRALIGIQPASTGWNLAPSEPVRAAIPNACAAVLSIFREWAHEC